jgi:hypothetical protein
VNGQSNMDFAFGKDRELDYEGMDLEEGWLEEKVLNESNQDWGGKGFQTGEKKWQGKGAQVVRWGHLTSKKTSSILHAHRKRSRRNLLLKTRRRRKEVSKPSD